MIFDERLSVFLGGCIWDSGVGAPCRPWFKSSGDFVRNGMAMM